LKCTVNHGPERGLKSYYGPFGRDTGQIQAFSVSVEITCGHENRQVACTIGIRIAGLFHRHSQVFFKIERPEEKNRFSSTRVPNWPSDEITQQQRTWDKSHLGEKDVVGVGLGKSARSLAQDICFSLPFVEIVSS